MRDGTTLTFEDLRREAAAALDDADETQSAVAEALGVHRSSVSHARKIAGPRYAELQRRIVEHLTPYAVEEVPRRWKVRRVE
jgi:hypothetical protein